MESKKKKANSARPRFPSLALLRRLQRLHDVDRVKGRFRDREESHEEAPRARWAKQLSPPFFPRRLLETSSFALPPGGGERKERQKQKKKKRPLCPSRVRSLIDDEARLPRLAFSEHFCFAPSVTKRAFCERTSGQTRGEMSSGIFPPQTSSSLFFSRILFALSLIQSKRILLPSQGQAHAQSQRTKGHDGARVDRPHGGGSSARSRRDGRRRRGAGGPGDGRDDCRRARGDASSARHTEGRHCGVQSQRGRGEGRALLGTRRCGGGRREKGGGELLFH